MTGDDARPAPQERVVMTIACALCFCVGQAGVEVDPGETQCCDPTEHDYRATWISGSGRAATTERLSSSSVPFAESNGPSL